MGTVRRLALAAGDVPLGRAAEAYLGTLSGAEQASTRRTYGRILRRVVAEFGAGTALEEQRNGEWRYLEFLQLTSLITAEMFLCEIPGGTEPGSGPAQLTCPNTDSDHSDQSVPVLFVPLFLKGRTRQFRAFTLRGYLETWVQGRVRPDSV